MTVAPTSGGGAVAVPDEDWGSTGLEDVGVGDVVTPRLTIVHDQARFKNNLSNEEFETIDAIVLGLVKQRIMWDEKVEDGDKPECKSPNFEQGFPNVRDDIPKDKRFPWEVSNFKPEDFPAENGINGLVTLPCSSCIFKEWGKGDWNQPPCSEQHTYPLLFTPDGGDTWIPALFTTQKTGIKPSKQFISSFAQTKTPMFTSRTTIGLTLQSRGSVKYSVPTFRRTGPTDRENWGEYAEQYRTIRDFIRSAPRPQDEEDEGTPAAPSSNENTAPAASAPAAAAPAPAAAAPAAPAGDDDLPF